MTESGLATDKVAGPEIFVHRKEIIEPSGSLEAFPFRFTLSVGKIII